MRMGAEGVIRCIQEGKRSLRLLHCLKRVRSLTASDRRNYLAVNDACGDIDHEGYLNVPKSTLWGVIFTFALSWDIPRSSAISCW
jgi:hypothetical protein